MTDPQIAILMLCLFIFLVLLGFPIAFTLLAMGVGFGYYAYYQGGADTFAELLNNNIFYLLNQNTYSVMENDTLVAIPLFLSLLVWVIFIGVGFKHQGIGYLKNSLFPPGVPAALYLLVTPIEFISTFLVRPFSLTVRLFANMLAGHILLVTFALLTEELVQGGSIALKPVGILPFFMLVFLTAFEVLVAFLQAYIFTILAAVYIGGAAHPEH